MASDLTTFAAEVRAEIALLREIATDIEKGALKTEKLEAGSPRDTTLETLATIQANISLHKIHEAGDGRSEPVLVGIPERPEDAYRFGFPSHQSMMRAIGVAVSRLAPATRIEFVLIRADDAVTVELPSAAMVRQ